MKKLLWLVMCLFGWSHSYSMEVEGETDDLDLSLWIQPADTALFVKDSHYYNWCNSVIRDEAGIYHLFYARWPKSVGFYSWLTHSEIAHATSDNPEGPYRNAETILSARPGEWDCVTMHNVQVRKFGDKYYLYYTSTNSGSLSFSAETLEEIGKTGYAHKYWGILRSNQRSGVAVATSPWGPWQRREWPLVEPEKPIWTVAVNPSVCQGEDNHYYLIVKGDDNPTPQHRAIQAVAVAETPEGPFVFENRPAFDDIPTEDVCVWYDRTRHRFYALFHAHGGNFIGMITSEDGRRWVKARHYEVCKKEIRLKDGTTMKVERMERPFVYCENGLPAMLSFGVKKGNEAFIVFYRLKNPISSR